jgi:hypothetical protein
MRDCNKEREYSRDYYRHHSGDHHRHHSGDYHRHHSGDHSKTHHSHKHSKHSHVDVRKLDEIINELQKLKHSAEKHHSDKHHKSRSHKYYCKRIARALKYLVHLTKHNLNELTITKCKLRNGVFNSVMTVSVFEHEIKKYISKLESLVPAIFKTASFSMTSPSKVDIKFDTELFYIGGNLSASDSNTDLLKKLDDIYANHILFLQFLKMKLRCIIAKYWK